MNSELRQHIKRLKHTLDIRGIEYELVHGAKHRKIIFLGNHANLRSFSITGTPSSHNSFKNEEMSLQRMVKDIPVQQPTVKPRVETPTMTPQPQPTKDVLLKFGVQRNGQLSVSIQDPDQLPPNFKNSRATIRGCSNGSVVVNFNDPNGVMPQVQTNGSITYCFSRSKTNISYGKEPVHGRTVNPSIAKFHAPNSLELATGLPAAIMQTIRTEEPPKKRLQAKPTTKSAPPMKVRPSGNLIEQGRALRDLFNEWAMDAAKAGISVEAEIENGSSSPQLKLYITQRQEL